VTAAQLAAALAGVVGTVTVQAARSAVVKREAAYVSAISYDWDQGKHLIDLTLAVIGRVHTGQDRRNGRGRIRRRPL